MKPIIKIEDLSKQYRVGALQDPYETFRETLARAARAPFQRFRNNGHSGATETVWALKNVSFDVNPGEVVGIIGRNGAGKSTLLKVLSRITEPTKGRVELYGRVGSLLEVGTGFHPELTGRENIFLNGTILGMKRKEIEAKFDEIVAFAEIDRYIDTPVKRYSSGMYLRLAFAVAAHMEPEILIVDEVLAVGDAAFQKKCLGKMQGVANEGKTILFVSHNMPAITRLCSKAILLEKGHLIEHGLTANVVTAYLNNVGDGDTSYSWSLASAPGTDEVKLVSVSLLNEDGTRKSVVNVEDRIKLKIGYYVGYPGLKFRCAALFFTQGVCAFASVEPKEVERRSVGYYCSTVTIPANLLTEGEHSVSVSIFSSRGVKHRYLTKKDVIVFHVSDSISGNSARGDYTEALTGVVSPRLQWELSVPE